MIFNFITDAYAMGPAPQGAGQAGGMQALIMNLAPLVLIFVIFYFLLIRPQQKKAKEVKKMLDELKKGDKIVTAGGIYGVIEGVEANTVTVKIAENVKIRVGRNSISTVRTGSDQE
ncbi:MAG TPA: preprotein translocase subunit YajC [Dissulfurispiraceae bacterium]|nr:preprotein translocase subunit YajC [Dissulfurispiraceae bacterium]